MKKSHKIFEDSLEKTYNEGVSPASRFYESMKNDPKEIIKWCLDEINAYRELIKLIKSKE